MEKLLFILLLLVSLSSFAQADSSKYKKFYEYGTTVNRLKARQAAYVGAFYVKSFPVPAANYTVQPWDCFLDLGEGSFTLTLPSASTSAGRLLIIRNGWSTDWTLSGTVKDPSAVTVTTIENNTVIQLMSNGTEWVTIK